MKSSRINVHLPVDELPSAVLKRQRSGAAEEEGIWTDFTTLGDDETAQQGPNISSNNTSASHIADNSMSSTAEGSQNFANDRSFRHKSYGNASIDPAAATRETGSMAAASGILIPIPAPWRSRHPPTMVFHDIPRIQRH
jgi:hypothetical protein